jgi:hypothetical protein
MLELPRGREFPESYGLHVPPGAPAWRLPPPETKMVFIDLSPAELCAVIRTRPWRRDLRAMLVHIRDDKLVAWGWRPGSTQSRARAARSIRGRVPGMDEPGCAVPRFLMLPIE